MTQTLASIDDLRRIYGAPNPVVLDKVVTRFDRHATAFMAAARFAVVNVRGPDGAPVPVMVGAAKGFARVLDPITVAVDVPRACWPSGKLGLPPVADFAVGTLFVIPGVKETLRLKGLARVAPGGDGGGARADAAAGGHVLPLRQGLHALARLGSVPGPLSPADGASAREPDGGIVPAGNAHRLSSGATTCHAAPRPPT